MPSGDKGQLLFVVAGLLQREMPRSSDLADEVMVSVSREWE